MKTLLLLLGLLILGVLFWGNTDFSPTSSPQAHQFSTERSVNIIGASMEPTLSIGQTVIADFAKIPVEGDIVSFQCLKSCAHPDGTSSDVGLVKRLIDIREDGAWYIKGDNQPGSWDSVDYGYIPKENISKVGVVIKILPR